MPKFPGDAASLAGHQTSTDISVMTAIEIIDEPTYTFGSQDNMRRYPFELNLSGGYRPSSTHGVLVDGAPAAIFAASGGATGVHSGSLLELGTRSYLAVGPYVVCFSQHPFQHHWTLRVDQATCFGVYHHDASGALLSHGELGISRFDESGRMIWSVSGEDIFTGEFVLHPDFIEVLDFNGKAYRFGYGDGREHV